jgi:hypothetical protein
LPFGQYKDHAACVAAHKDKADPDAYCAAMERQMQGGVAKLDVDQNLVFGWFSVAVQKSGDPLIDKQGDIIEPTELESAAYEFVLNFREADEMHSRITKGHLVESWVVTPEKLMAMGLKADAIPAGWWGGFKVDPDTFQKVKAGTLKMFSIEGMAERVEV